MNNRFFSFMTKTLNDVVQAFVIGWSEMHFTKIFTCNQEGFILKILKRNDNGANAFLAQTTDKAQCVCVRNAENDMLPAAH